MAEIYLIGGPYHGEQVEDSLDSIYQREPGELPYFRTPFPLSKADRDLAGGGPVYYYPYMLRLRIDTELNRRELLAGKTPERPSSDEASGAGGPTEGAV